MKNLKLKSILLATTLALSTSFAYAADTNSEKMGDKVERKADKAGEYMSDSAITTKVKSKLLAAKDLKSTDVSVETTNGVVLLTGTVENRDAKQRVVSLAKETKGVHDVKDDLKTM